MHPFLVLMLNNLLLEILCADHRRALDCKSEVRSYTKLCICSITVFMSILGAV